MLSTALTARSEYVVERLQSDGQPEFAAVVELYQETFPECERKSTAALRSMVADAAYHLLFARSGGEIAGFSLLRQLHSGGAALLEYMAVAQDHRGRGLGRHLFAASAQAAGAPPAVLLIEVESDRETAAGREARRGRKRFYRSLGAREVEKLRWIMPPVAQGTPPPMELFAFAPGRKSLHGDELRQWLTAIYVEVYGKPSDDQRIGEMLLDLPGTIRLV